VLAVLFAAGLVGSQGGGTTESGVEIQAVTLRPAPPAPARGVLGVGPQVGKLAPDFDISDFEGVRHRLSDFRGRPVYINFWATWCVPCQIELPDIQELLDRHEGELVVIAVNRAQRLDRARSYFEKLRTRDGEQGISFTVNGLDTDDTLYRTYRGLGMPVSIFIDADGVVTRVHNSILRLPQMEEAVAEALASAPLSGGETTGAP